MESRREHPNDHLAIRELITSELVHRDNLKRMHEVMTSKAFQSHIAGNGALENIVAGIIVNTEALLKSQYNQAPWSIEIEEQTISVLDKYPGRKEEVLVDKKRVFAVGDPDLIDDHVRRALENPEELKVLVEQMKNFAFAMQPLLTQAISITDANSVAGNQMVEILSRAGQSGMPKELSDYQNGVNPIYVVQRGPRYKMLLEGLQVIEKGKEPPQVFVDVSKDVEQNIDVIGDVTKRANDVFGEFTHLASIQSEGFNAVFAAAMNDRVFDNPATFQKLLQEHHDLQDILDAPDEQFDPVIKSEVGNDLRECQDLIVDVIKECLYAENKAESLSELEGFLEEKIRKDLEFRQMHSGIKGQGNITQLDMQRQSVGMILSGTLNNVAKIISAELDPPSIGLERSTKKDSHAKAAGHSGPVTNLQEAMNSPINNVLDAASFNRELLGELQRCFSGISEHANFDKILGSNKPVVELLGKFIQAIQDGATKKDKDAVRSFAITKNVSHGAITMKELLVAAIAEAVSKQVMSTTNNSKVLTAIMFGGSDICKMLATDKTALSQIELTPQEDALSLFNYNNRANDAKTASAARESIEKHTAEIAPDLSVPRTVSELMYIVPNYTSKTTLGRKKIKSEIQDAARSVEGDLHVQRDAERQRQAEMERVAKRGISLGKRRGSTGSTKDRTPKASVPGKSASDPTHARKSPQTPPPSLKTPTTLFSSRSRSGSTTNQDQHRKLAEEAAERSKQPRPGRGGGEDNSE